MRAFRPLHRLVAGSLLGLSLLAQAAGGIFTFTDEEGIEHLSNIPDDRRYRPIQGSFPHAFPVPGPSAPGHLPRPLGQRPFHDQVRQASHDTGLDAALLHAVISVESGYNQAAVSAKGAGGLMQLMPGTARRYGLHDRLDPGGNIGAGARYLRDLLDLFDGSLELALAAYNAGENAVLRHGRRIPPYAETRRYVPLVLAQYRRLAGESNTQRPSLSVAR